MDRWRVRACVALLGLFWVLVSYGGVVNDGYRQWVDFISSLGARGVDRPWIGAAALLAAAAAHAVVVPELRRQDRWVGYLVAAAAVCLLLVALFPIRCPGAPYCGPVGQVRWIDVVHMSGVLTYSVVMVAAMVRAAVRALRIPRWRSWGIGSLAAAAVFTVALVSTQGASPGLSQRFWALAGQVWLVLAATIPFATPVGTKRTRATVVRDTGSAPATGREPSESAAERGGRTA